MTSTSHFKIEKDHHIAWLILNRPEKRNVMDLAFFDEIGACFDNFDRNPDIRVVIIRAEGESFSAGTDLEEAATLINQQSAEGRDKMQKSILALQEGFTKIESCRKPVIAAIHSHCIGGGIDLICACDMRMAAKDAVFSIRETRMGIIADLGTLQRLPHIIGHNRTGNQRGH
jgi:enoyl-CoA hydratase